MIEANPPPLDVANLVVRALQGDHATISALTLTTRQWRAAARPFLWQRVCIDGSTAERWQRAVNKSQFLLGEPSILALIRDLRFVGDEGEGLIELFRDLISAVLPDLKSLDVDACGQCFDLTCLLHESHAQLGRLRMAPTGNGVPFAINSSVDDEEWSFGVASSWRRQGRLVRRYEHQSLDVPCFIWSPYVLFSLLREVTPTSVVTLRLSTETLALLCAAIGQGGHLLPATLRAVFSLQIVPCRCEIAHVLDKAVLARCQKETSQIRTLIVQAPALLTWPLAKIPSIICGASVALTRLHLDHLTLYNGQNPFTLLDGLLRAFARHWPNLEFLDLCFPAFDMIQLPQRDYRTGQGYCEALAHFHHLRHLGLNLMPLAAIEGAAVGCNFVGIARAVLATVEGIEEPADMADDNPASIAFQSRLLDKLIEVQCNVATTGYKTHLALCPTLRSYALPIGAGDALVVYSLSPTMDHIDGEGMEGRRDLACKLICCAHPLSNEVVRALQNGDDPLTMNGVEAISLLALAGGA